MNRDSISIEDVLQNHGWRIKKYIDHELKKHFLNSKFDRSDILQSVLKSLVDKKPDPENIHSIEGLIKVRARLKIIDKLRRKSNREKGLSGELENAIQDGELAVDALLEKQEVVDIVREILESLSSLEKAIISARLDGKTFEQIKKELDWTKSTQALSDRYRKILDKIKGMMT